MSPSLRNPVVAGIIALVVVILLASTFAIVPETRQAVILRLEKPVGLVNAWKPGQQFGNTGAGLVAPWPFIDQLVWVDKRLLGVDPDNHQRTERRGVGNKSV